MLVCPECRAVYDDQVKTCPQHGLPLVAKAADDTLEPGTVVSEYVIGKKLGAGTFGEVYAGEHPLIGKKVAVKVLHRRFASDPDMVSRFVAEARAVNRIRQRNIIDIFAFGVIPDRGRQYFVMELLDGLTLGALLAEKGRLPMATILTIAQGVAAALDAVHEAGITHRDLKPDNVFLALERDGAYFPKLLDFGIAKLVGDDIAHRTDAGVVMGTPRYMSPEQAHGRSADHLSDIYSLGVMIHEMLTGAVPFPGDSAMDVLLKHTSETPPPVSTVCPDLPRELDAVVLAMLAKRPKDRPKSAGQAVAALAARAKDLGLDRQEARPPSSAATAVIQGAAAPITVPMDRSRPRRPAAADSPEGVAQTVDLARSGSDALASSETVPIADAVAAPPSGAVAQSANHPAIEPAAESAEVLRPVETENRIGRRKDRLRGRLIAAVAGSLAVAASLWAIGRSSSPTAPGSGIVVHAPQALVPSAPSAQPTAAAEPATGAGTAAPSSTISLRLATRPADVEVWRDDHRIGTSADPIAIPRGADRITVRLKKPGFKDADLAITPDRDLSLEATLTPAATASPRPATKAASSAGRLDKILGDRD